MDANISGRPGRSPAAISLPVGVLVGVWERKEEDAESCRWLQPRDYLIGRSPKCDLWVADETGGISRKHARLRWIDQGFEIGDEKSRQGTSVNDRRLAPGESVRLSDADRILLGGW